MTPTKVSFIGDTKIRVVPKDKLVVGKAYIYYCHKVEGGVGPLTQRSYIYDEYSFPSTDYYPSSWGLRVYQE